VVSFEALDLSGLQNKVIGFSFDIILLDNLQHNTPNQSSPEPELDAGGGGRRQDIDHKKASMSAKNMNQKLAFKLKPGKKYSDFTVH
jgi:hypothetical protein